MKAIDEVRWQACHALMRGEPPTQQRMATLMGVHITTLVSKIRARGWVVLDFRRKDMREAHDGLWKSLHARFMQGAAGPQAGLSEDFELACAVKGEAVGGDAGEAGEAGAEQSPEEKLARLGRILSRQIERMLLAADAAGGYFTKAEADTLAVTLRLAEKFGAIASERAAERQERTDAELAAILRRVDERIEELARQYAARLAAPKR